MNNADEPKSVQKPCEFHTARFGSRAFPSLELKCRGGPWGDSASAEAHFKTALLQRALQYSKGYGDGQIDIYSDPCGTFIYSPLSLC